MNTMLTTLFSETFKFTVQQMLQIASQEKAARHCWPHLFDGMQRDNMNAKIKDYWTVLSSRCDSIGFLDQPQG